MTPKEINDLKKEHNALLERGQDLYAEVMDLHERCLNLQSRIKDAEGPDYDPIPLIFGSGFNLDPDL
jgi:hypothetical protein